jgi:AbrB family looped-hinge helix DNA binding protein
MITTVTGKNQITIPAKLVKELNIQPETRLDWTVNDEGMLLARLLPPRAEVARQAAGMGREWLPPGVDPVADVIEERAQAGGKID